MTETLKAEDLYELAREIKDDYGTRDSELDDIQKYYFLDQDKQDKAAEAEGIEVVHLPYGSNTVDLVQDLVVGADLGITVPALSEKITDRQLADTAEELLAVVIDQSERTQHQGILARAVWFAAVRGCVAGRVMAIDKWLEKDKQNDEEMTTGQRFPVVIQLRDPRYVYPAFGLDGVACVVEWRERTVRDIRNSLGDDELLPDNEAKDKVEWVEYWDADRFCYWAAGEVVKLGSGTAGPWPNLYGGVPYAFEFARQSGVLTPEKRARPLLGPMRPVIDRMEILDSAEATALLQYMGDALAYFSDNHRQLDLTSGAINYLDPEDRLDWIRTQRTPPGLEIAYNKYSSQLERGTFPSTMYGLDPGRVMAGYAINMLNQSGQARLTTILECLERFLGRTLENVLMVCENYVANLINGPILFYSMSDAEDQTGNRRRVRREQKFDASKLGGFYNVEVRLGDLLPADQQANVVLATRSREPGPDGRPLLSWESVLEQYNISGNISEERERINREIAASDPMVMALQQALYTAELIEEYSNQLQKMGIDPDEVLMELQMQGPPGGEPGQGPAPAGLPPEVMPPAMQGQLMPQPMGGMEEGLGGMPPGLPIPGGM